MNKVDFGLPVFLKEICKEDVYWKWLSREATRFYNEDQEVGEYDRTSRYSYRTAIHKAVLRHGEVDAYTGAILNWKLVGRFNSKQAKKLGKQYRAHFADAPVADRIDNIPGSLNIAICSWRVFYSKKNLDYAEFLSICSSVSKYAEKKGVQIR